MFGEVIRKVSNAWLPLYVDNLALRLSCIQKNRMSMDLLFLGFMVLVSSPCPVFLSVLRLVGA